MCILCRSIVHYGKRQRNYDSPADAELYASMCLDTLWLIFWDFQLRKSRRATGYLKIWETREKKGNIIFHRYEPVKYIRYIPNFKLRYSLNTPKHIFLVSILGGEMNRDVLQNSTVVFPRLWVHKYGSQSPGGQMFSILIYISITTSLLLRYECHQPSQTISRFRAKTPSELSLVTKRLKSSTFVALKIKAQVKTSPGMIQNSDKVQKRASVLLKIVDTIMFHGRNFSFNPQDNNARC